MIQNRITPHLILGIARENMKLEDLTTNAAVRGVVAGSLVTVVSVKWFGDSAVELTYKTPSGNLANELLYRDDESRIEIMERGRPWSFDGDGAQFRLVSEAQRIRLAHLFDPVLAVHISDVEPLPHQITAVYESMLPRLPLRFLLADDPGAGKTIMAGLLIKELIARGDIQRCLVVCPGALAEQWQDELSRRFQLPFEILTNDKLDSAHTGNWFLETNLAIARLDKLSRDESVQQKLQAPDCEWDLVICDEAHKMSASFFGGEVRYTKRYHLGQLLSGLTRHFLLMTATPHNGKEEDFQLFMALIDNDRFEGRFREGGSAADVSDLMRRMVKESLLKFDSTPLFPERMAYTVPYKLSEVEARLYHSVTQYVKEEFDRADALANDTRAGNVGFALTILQRRLASSPEAIYQSLRRRRERLEGRMAELQTLRQGGQRDFRVSNTAGLDPEDIEDLDDAPGDEFEEQEQRILDQATAAQTLDELKSEIGTVKNLEATANAVLRTGGDTKWRELATLLNAIFTPQGGARGVADLSAPYGSEGIPRPVPSPQQKLVIFTEHRDTLNYLQRRIADLVGRQEAVVVIHGGMRREDRRASQESFRHDPRVQILLATDAAGEGINLQRAHLMVNYDLPWNPNRIEQRFGRIHRIGQTQVCHLWNLVAEETREGDVYRTLLEKLEQARNALGGRVFDVLGKVQFGGRPLRDLLVEAVRYGERPEIQARLTTIVDDALDYANLRDLLEERSLAPDAMDASRVHRIREDMERAEARRLQPHYIESFFLEAFRRLGGTARQREPRRYEITHVPAPVRNRSLSPGTGRTVLLRYERVAFEKSLLSDGAQPAAAFVCPGHPLLDAVIDHTLEGNANLLRQGTVLVDDQDTSSTPRVLFFLENCIQDATTTRSGGRRVISKRMLYVELDAFGNARHMEYAPYLDYRPLAEDEPSQEEVLGQTECAWIGGDLEPTAQQYAVSRVVPEHLAEVRQARQPLIAKTKAAVLDRLTKEISYWDRRAGDLKAGEQAGRINARLNSVQAQRRADLLQERRDKRLTELDLEDRISPLPPVVLGVALIVPVGLIRAMSGSVTEPVASSAAYHGGDTQAAAAKAREIVMAVERGLGFEPTDREFEKRGYDVESRLPDTGKLRFIEVKGRVSGASTILVTRNEILYSLNKPDDYILAIVEFLGDDGHQVHYVRQPFQREPDFGATSVNYDFAELLEKASPPS